MSYFPEFDRHGRYIESPCYGCDLDDCRYCPRENKKTDMKTINVAMINDISLQVVAEGREQLLAVKPVCEILGVAYPPQVPQPLRREAPRCQPQPHGCTEKR